MHESPASLISGRFVLPDGGARQRYVLVRDGVIEWISRSRPPRSLVEGSHEVTTGPQDWIFPGLIDLHSHTGYNLLPLWRSVRAPFDNRHVWRNDDNYRASIGGVLKKLGGNRRWRKVFSELQAVAGGTTTLDEPRPLDAEASEGASLLCRSTGRSADMGLAQDREIRSIVDFFKPDAHWRPVPAEGWDGSPGALEEYVRDREHLQSVLVHVAEGRSGFGSHRGVDPYSRAEFEALMQHPSMEDVEAVRASHLAVVHGSGIDVTDSRHIDFLVDRRIAVVWSPASNLILYDDTLDVHSLIEAGLTVALGSDWSPSGSKHIWEEAKFARFYLDAIGSRISDAEIFKMATTHPGRVVGLPYLGRIEEGAFADLFILRSPIESDNALEVFFTTTDRDVLATIVGGLPIYGDRRFLGQFGIALQPLPRREGRAVANKGVHLPASLGLTDLAAELDRIEDRLKELGTYRSNLLADSDMPYRRSFQMLRSRVEGFGWTVRRTLKVGSSATPGRVLVPPKAAMLRVGYKGEQSDDDFLQALGATVLPAAAALGSRIRLSSLLAATAPSRSPRGCPDALLLSFYRPSPGRRRDFAAMRADSLGGRASELVQRAAFAQTSVREPTRYAGDPRFGRLYHLFDEEVDWAVGDVRLLLASRRNDASEADFRAAAKEALDALQAPGAGPDAALATLDSDWMAVWSHATSGDATSDQAWTLLAPVARILVDRSCAQVEAKCGLADAWQGLELRRGEVVRVGFERLDLLPW